MACKQWFAGVDTETTINDRVADFGIVIHDIKGNIATKAGVMVKGIFGAEPLFYNKDQNSIWSSKSVADRTEKYNAMIDNGLRILASPAAINNWIAKAIGKYNPTLYAYNLAFDAEKCGNTNIDLSGFSNRFCLWGAAVGNICKTKKYKQFILDNHLFNGKTAKGNMTFSTTAEAVTAYLNGGWTDEPHTSIEDLIGYEIPTLVHIARKRGWKDKIEPYNWRHFQVKNHYKAN